MVALNKLPSAFSLSTHTHANDHAREHAMTGTSDHNGTAWRMFYADGSGDIQEVGLGTSTQVLTSNGVSAAPSFQVGGGSGSGFPSAADIWCQIVNI